MVVIVGGCLFPIYDIQLLPETGNSFGKRPGTGHLIQVVYSEQVVRGYAKFLSRNGIDAYLVWPIVKLA
jgi:hypothetical protein